MARRSTTASTAKTVFVNTSDEAMLNEALCKHACDRPDSRTVIRAFAAAGDLAMVVRFVDHLREMERARQGKLALGDESDPRS